MEVREKIVDFSWCKKCKYWLVQESKKPCHECLDNPSNEDSRRPIKFKEANTNDISKESKKYASNRKKPIEAKHHTLEGKVS